MCTRLHLFMKSETMPIELPNVPLDSRVGILGGSFDPPHLGHQLLGLAALATTSIDYLWVVPCANHAFQKSLSSFEHRHNMCELAFARLDKTHVLSIENILPAPSYTIHTIEAILKLRPDLKLSLIMGSDLMEHFDRWEEANKIRQLCKLSVFDRTTLLPGVQSSQIREAVKLGDTRNLDLDVKTYIEENRLYF